MNAPNFIGLGVEKSGTSWIFACLYEHPEICIPIKEVNFFTEEHKWVKGKSSYEYFFKDRCTQGKITGEFSTSYFYNGKAAQRIHDFYPAIKLIVCLRNPIDRAYSNYLNDIKAGTINKDISFEKASELHDYYINQGRYKKQFDQYLSFFKREQLKIMIYDDLLEDPLSFIQNIYRFLEVDAAFVPPSLHERINAGRVPSNVGVEKMSNGIADFLQQSKLGERIWWLIKKSQIPALLRKINTQSKKDTSINPKMIHRLSDIFKEDVIYIEELLNRKLDWIEEKH